MLTNVCMEGMEKGDIKGLKNEPCAIFSGCQAIVILCSILMNKW